MAEPVCFHLVRDLPAFKEGDDLVGMILERFPLRDGDVVCIASTVVSKSEGRTRRLEDYTPSSRSMEIAERLDKDPRFVEAVLEESQEVILESPFLLVATRFGHVGVNAGIDLSNVGGERILLLPEDPKASADRIRRGLQNDCAVIVTDTSGRPFRCGVAGVAVGWSGIAALRDWRGERDLEGRELEITLEAIADEIAGMANFLMGEAGGGTPVVVVRGLSYPKSGGGIFRPRELDVIRARLQESESRS
ncbi:coenzyme F420-0:L-glutamate ligase [Methanotrichaceae archaeon M04Ac]|uniref:Coenzyme F420:L-glutamate ligase n=1 Tax=Candidatus Methanocrinis alkalitolerans TaxID=3033395 RepID=A0ABT5XFY6_9EURY|nr:coenzyme F420-0:L-glutamate ligase [Candidatus Methanocrinis alkalitolerans]MCR3883002.1 coenzyme F420-0:L-glutamate ligase [Methanothrix sp.]MDF0593412.1 coenzyme F420-0:L-glutamate ligase [Candidatus Methanocrinis alkalitolerans]